MNDMVSFINNNYNRTNLCSCSCSRAVHALRLDKQQYQSLKYLAVQMIGIGKNTPQLIERFQMNCYPYVERCFHDNKSCTALLVLLAHHHWEGAEPIRVQIIGFCIASGQCKNLAWTTIPQCCLLKSPSEWVKIHTHKLLGHFQVTPLPLEGTIFNKKVV